MGKKSPSPPPTPDPAATAKAQGAANKETAIANAQIGMVDQTNPWGNVTFRELPNPNYTPRYERNPEVWGNMLMPAGTPDQNYTPRYERNPEVWGNVSNAAMTQLRPRFEQLGEGRHEIDGQTYRVVAPGGEFAGADMLMPAGTPDQNYTPRYERNETLAPEQQRMLDLTNQAGIGYGEMANQQLAGLRDILGNPLDMGSLGPMPTPDTGYREQVIGSMMERQNPYIDREREALETRLANQGIGIQSEAYDAAMDNWYRGQNDMRLAMDARAGDEMARMYGLETDARSRRMNEMVTGRTQPLNELAALMTGAQVQQPQFANTPMPQMAAPDIMGATYGSANLANQQYQQQVQSAAANRQGLYSLLGTGAMAAGYAAPAFAFSDRRLKRDVKRVGTLVNGLPVYLFRYKSAPGWHVGLMAQDVAKVKPEAVKVVNGYMAVHYPTAMEAA